VHRNSFATRKDSLPKRKPSQQRTRASRNNVATPEATDSIPFLPHCERYRLDSCWHQLGFLNNHQELIFATCCSRPSAWQPLSRWELPPWRKDARKRSEADAMFSYYMRLRTTSASPATTATVARDDGSSERDVAPVCQSLGRHVSDADSCGTGAERPAAADPPYGAQRATVAGAFELHLLFRWFVGIDPDEVVWKHAVFSKNQERLLHEEVAEVFFHRVLERRRCEICEK
jgi:Transposase domain (DUF772)